MTDVRKKGLFKICALAAAIVSSNSWASDDTFSVQRGIVGKGLGDDTYVLSASLIDSNAQITITDTQGFNSLQLIGGLSITGSIIAEDTMKLTLSNGAEITILGASSFSYILGGDPLAGTAGSSKTYQSFVSDALGASVPQSGTINGNGSEISSDGTAVVTAPSTGSSSKTVSVGEITAFGSVIVNGVHYDISSSSIETDDGTGSVTDLELGMQVTIEGEIDESTGEGVATSINYHATLEGPIESIDLAAQSFVVLAQTVNTDELTQFDNVTFDTLMVGNVVEVSGHVNSDGSILATRVDKQSDTAAEGSTVYRIAGDISNLDVNGETFTIGDLVVDYSSAEFFDLPEGGLIDGLSVVIESIQAPQTGVLTASKVTLEALTSGTEMTENQKMNLEGFIDSFVSGAEFTINDYPVITNDETSFRNGNADNLILGIRIKVKGSVDSEGRLLANEINFHKNSKIEIEGLVESVDQDEQTVTILGSTIKVDPDTRFQDHSDDKVREFGLDDIVSGDELEVRGYVSDDGILASRIKRHEGAADIDEEPIEHEVELSGFVESALLPELVVNGVTVTTTADSEFEDDQHNTITQEAFFDLIQVDDLVEIEGYYDSEGDGQLVVQSIEISTNDETDNTEVELEGSIDSFTSLTEFTVNGHQVTTSDDTEFSGAESGSLAEGVDVEVEGTQTMDGIIQADKISFEFKKELRVEATIDAIDQDAGTITVLGISVLINSDSHFTGKKTLADLEEGDFVRIKGYENPELANQIVATTVHQQGNGNGKKKLTLKGYAADIASPNFSILGVQVFSTDSTGFEIDDDDINLASFFQNLSAGDLVTVKGSLSEGEEAGLQATSIELEQDDNEEEGEDSSDSDTPDDEDAEDSDNPGDGE